MNQRLLGLDDGAFKLAVIVSAVLVVMIKNAVLFLSQWDKDSLTVVTVPKQGQGPKSRDHFNVLVNSYSGAQSSLTSATSAHDLLKPA